MAGRLENMAHVFVSDLRSRLHEQKEQCLEDAKKLERAIELLERWPEWDELLWLLREAEVIGIRPKGEESK